MSELLLLYSNNTDEVKSFKKVPRHLVKQQAHIVFLNNFLTHYQQKYQQSFLKYLINLSKQVSFLKLLNMSKSYQFSKTSPFETENYRPISLLSNVDKILEKLVHKRMMQFLEKNKILRDRQFRFRKKHSTVHGLVTLTKH